MVFSVRLAFLFSRAYIKFPLVLQTRPSIREAGSEHLTDRYSRYFFLIEVQVDGGLDQSGNKIPFTPPRPGFKFFGCSQVWMGHILL